VGEFSTQIDAVVGVHHFLKTPEEHCHQQHLCAYGEHLGWADKMDWNCDLQWQ